MIQSLNLPDGCTPLEHQVAGHFYGKGKLGFLQTNDGHVLKPVQSPPRGEREHNFFKRLFSIANESDLNGDEIDLRRIIPTYFGSVVHGDIVYIKMENLAHRMKNPAVIDFKLGRITYDPEATSDKIQRQLTKYPPCEITGFQLIGMRVFSERTGRFSKYDKLFGRSLPIDDLIHAMALFFQFHETPQRQAIRMTLEKFVDVLEWFETQRTYHFYSASLLIVYEAQLERLMSDAANNNSNQQQSPINELVSVKLADFAHVFPAGGESRDENNLHGVRNLMSHLRDLLKETYEFKDIRPTKD